MAKPKRSRDYTGMNPDDRLQAVVEDFAVWAYGRINELQAEELIEKNGINPLLIWALGINDFHSLAKFTVYQRLGRSFVTSFGQTVVEEMVRSASGGRKGEWWDVVKEGRKENLYVSVKTGPADMNKDQVDYFVPRAKKQMAKDPKAVPIIGMVYGRKLWSAITLYLKKNGLDPEKHAFFGRALFDRISQDPSYHVKLPKLVRDGAAKAVSNRKIISLIDAKVNEIEAYFAKHYRNVDELLDYVSEPPRIDKTPSADNLNTLDSYSDKSKRQNQA